VFPVRHELSAYILFRRNSVCKGLRRSVFTLMGLVKDIVHGYANTNSFIKAKVTNDVLPDTKILCWVVQNTVSYSGWSQVTLSALRSDTPIEVVCAFINIAM
jgi:hypothetical protein